MSAAAGLRVGRPDAPVLAVLFRRTDKNGHEAVMFIKEERLGSIMAQPI